MSDGSDLPSVVDAAARAAAAGDYVLAEQLLRKVASLQEASLGPLDPDFANTLNNLAVVCEFTSKTVDAERYFRQACAIAGAVLPSGHPFVATSRKNLEDFCAARGKAVDSPAPPVPVAVGADARLEGFAVRQRVPPCEVTQPAASGRRSRSLAVAVLFAGGLLVTFMTTTTWFHSTDETEPSSGSPSLSPPANPAAEVASPSEPIPPDAPPEVAIDRAGAVDVESKTRGAGSVPAGGRQVRAPTSEPPGAENRAASGSVPQLPVVAAAHLCRDLSTAGMRGGSSDWRCVPPRLPVGPGSLFFYTRLKSPAQTTVQHRWYRRDRLRQVVELRIRANTTSGYRTYSRNTVDDQGAGDWRVELRTAAGVLLHEERFIVR